MHANMHPKLRIGLIVLSVAVALTLALGAVDVLLTGNPIEFGDLASDFAETLVLATGMVAVVFLVTRVRDLETESGRIRAEMADAADAGQAWRRQSEHLFRGLSEAVATQFDDWGLTEAEADIAALILKGATMKDIARLRRTSDATIRQQAQGIYRKSGLANRSELAAYFLEDLFDVAAARATGPSAGHAPH